MADQTNLPNAFLSIFTPAELRVIRAIFAAISAEGRCTKRLDEIAAMASASRSTAPKAGDKGNLTKQESNGLFMCLRRVGSDSNLCFWTLSTWVPEAQL
jgi:hypothetical protein